MISRPMAFVGLVCLLVLGRGLLTGAVGIATAGGRAGALLAALWFLDRTVVPLVREMVGQPERRRSGDEPRAPSPTA